MKSLKLFSLAVVAAALFASCSMTMPVTATSNKIGNKVGTSVGTVYLGFLSFDADASIRTAAKNGGISKISTVDMKVKNTLGIIINYETIVTGE